MQAEGCAVSKAMLDDIAAQEAACRATLQRAQDKMQRLNCEAEIATQQALLDDLQRRASALRQVGVVPCAGTLYLTYCSKLCSMHIVKHFTAPICISRLFLTPPLHCDRWEFSMFWLLVSDIMCLTLLCTRSDASHSIFLHLNAVSDSPAPPEVRMHMSLPDWLRFDLYGQRLV